MKVRNEVALADVLEVRPNQARQAQLSLALLCSAQPISVPCYRSFVHQKNASLLQHFSAADGRAEWKWQKYKQQRFVAWISL